MPATTTAITYRSLFAIQEFRVLFLNRCVVVISVAASGLALATITYEATGSAVLSGLSMFGGPLISLVVTQLLLAWSDRVRPRRALTFQLGATLIANAAQLLPGIPWQATPKRGKYGRPRRIVQPTRTPCHARRRSRTGSADSRHGHRCPWL